MLKIAKHIPNSITSLNLISGLLAVILAFEGRFLYAALAIVAASVFDFLDGLSARLLHAYSDIGKQLDSLADIVSFGVAPAMMVWNYMLLSLYGSNHLLPVPQNFCYCHIPRLIAPLFIVVFSALRLAKFNIDTRQTDSFLGIPTPACALFLSSIAFYTDGTDGHWLTDSRLLAIVSYLLSFLLVSEIPMFSLKFKNLSWADNIIRYVFLMLAVCCLAFFALKGIGLTIGIYIIFSISVYGWGFFTKPHSSK